mgnify:CR=1 FL=1
MICIDGEDQMLIKDESDFKNPVVIKLGKAEESMMDAILDNINRLRHHCVAG